MSKYLSHDEQFKKVLNQEEIERIEDQELRKIRSKFWSERHKAFLDERGIPDVQLDAVLSRIAEQEQAEISEYKKRRGFEE